MAKAVGIFASFCLLSSGVYIFNDIIDAGYDKNHPNKKNRPLAADKISKQAAFLVSCVLIGGAFLSIANIYRPCVWIFAVYLANNIVYSLKLRDIAILDVMSIAVGFILRLLAGASVSSVRPSHWILLTTFFLALFLGFAKRRAEFFVQTENNSQVRLALGGYTRSMLDDILTTLMAVIILCYSLYATSDYAIERFKTENLIYTIPFVIFGVLRYFQRIHLTGQLGDPTEMLIKDKPTLVNLTLWAVVCILIIYR